MARLEALYAGERLSHVFVLCGIGGPSFPAVGDIDAANWVEKTLEQLAPWVEYAWDTKIHRPICLEAWIYGVHFVDAVLGADVRPTTQEGAGGWWTECLTTPVGMLQPPDLSQSAPWRKAQSLALAMRGSGLTVPFFAPQVLASPLNIAVNLYGEEFLMALVLEPDAARHDLRIITDTIVAMVRWYQANMPPMQFQPVGPAGRCQPRGFGQICGCSTQLLSRQSYQEFIAPLDAQVLSAYPQSAGMIHLCGSHTQHIPTWRDMPEMRAVQLNDRAAEDLPLYFRELRDDQLIYLNPCDEMTVEHALAVTGGRRLVIVANLSEAPECSAQ